LGSGLIVSRNPDSVLGPDIQLFAKHRPPDTLEGWPSVPPVLIAEVMDGQEDYFHIMNKVELYLQFGIDLIWIVTPGVQVQVFELKRKFPPLADRSLMKVDALCTCRPNWDTLTGGKILPGFSCKVSDLFG
jgi:Uma2 family endonuclease